MKCPNCNFENTNNSIFCGNCGTAFSQYFPSQIPQNTQIKQLNYNMSMKFHFVFCIMLFFAAVVNITEVIISITEFNSLSVFSLLLCPFNITTGIFLFKKKKAGYIMSIISNILGIIASCTQILFAGMLLIFSSIFSFLAELSTDVLNEIFIALGQLGIAIFIPILLIAIGVIVINAIAIFYFYKRKHLFL